MRRTGFLAFRESRLVFTRGKQITSRESRKAGGRTCRAIGLDGGRRMRSVPLLCRRTLREKASAYCFSLRAVQATAVESRLRGRARSQVCRRWSIFRRARNVLWGASRSHLNLSRHRKQARCGCEETGIACPPQASRKMPRSLDSRILAEDSGPWLSSLSERIMFP